MTNEEKLKVFEFHLNMIKSDVIKRFTEYCIVNFPDYFWKIPASTQNKYHGKDETLIDHIQNCLWLAQRVILQFKDAWSPRQVDQFISAIILHDGFKCNNLDGSISIFTQKIIDIGNLSDELLGKFKTSKEHPEVGYNEYIKLSLKFNCDCVANKQNTIGDKDLSPILNAVRFHSGPWSINIVKDKFFSLDWPFSNIAIQVHNIDYMSAINAEFWTRK